MDEEVKLALGLIALNNDPEFPDLTFASRALDKAHTHLDGIAHSAGDVARERELKKFRKE